MNANPNVNMYSAGTQVVAAHLNEQQHKHQQHQQQIQQLSSGGGGVGGGGVGGGGGGASGGIIMSPDVSCTGEESSDEIQRY